MNTNILGFSDFDEESQIEMQKLSFLNVDDLKKEALSKNPLDKIGTTKSIREIFNEISLETRGKNSLFYTPHDGDFVHVSIDKKYLIEKIIKFSNNRNVLSYNLVAYNLGIITEFEIDNQVYNVKVELNTLSGQIDFSKQPRFKFRFNLPKQEAEFKIIYEFIKFKNSADCNRVAIILTFYKYVDLKIFLDKLNKELIKLSIDPIKKEFNKAFILAKGQSEVLDFIYETAPDFVLEDRKDLELYNDLILLSNQRIDTVRTNENISILNILDNFKDKKWFSNKINEDPTIVRNLFQKFSNNYIEKLILAVSKIGNSIWTIEDKESAWNYELYYPELEFVYTDKTNVNDPYMVSTGFAYYNEGLKMFKIGTAIFAYDSRVKLVPSNSREIGPVELQYAYIPMQLQIGKNTIYIPVFVAEYFTNKKIDEEWWTMLNNLVIGLLPETSASSRAVSTIAKLFGGKKIQTIEELIAFLDKIDESVKATELEQYGIEALFRGTTRNAQGELFVGNVNSIANGSSTSTDPYELLFLE
jgi:hypothetical protein